MKRSLVLLVAVAALFSFLFPQVSKAGEEKPPEVISLLGKKLYATPAEGEELSKLEAGLQEALKAVEADPENKKIGDGPNFVNLSLTLHRRSVPPPIINPATARPTSGSYSPHRPDNRC